MNIKTNPKALIAVDCQYGFMEGGHLPVDDAWGKMVCLANYLHNNKNKYDVIFLTADWHPYHHCSFNTDGGQWPSHCVQHTKDAAIFDEVLIAAHETCNRVYVMTKGSEQMKDEYSIFALENGNITNENGIEMAQIINFEDEPMDIDICGIAGDVCVLNTLRDAIELFGAERMTVLTDYCASLDGGATLNKFIEDNNINKA